MLCRGGLRLVRAPLPRAAPPALRRQLSSSRRPRSAASAAMDVEDLGAAAPARDRVSFGRAEMYSEALAGTVKAYDCHVFLCSGTPPAEWAHATDAVPGPHSALAEALKTPEVKAALGGVKTTLYAPGGGDDAPGDILLFPQARRSDSLLAARVVCAWRYC
jgi:hypothetical protein